MQKTLEPVPDGAPSFERDTNVIRRNEVPFRRGLCHGAHYAVSALRSGATLEQLEAWVDRVDTWRFDESKDIVTMPPSARAISW